MVIKDNLSVVRGIYLSSGYIFILFYVRVHIYDLPISFVSEK